MSRHPCAQGERVVVAQQDSQTETRAGWLAHWPACSALTRHNTTDSARIAMPCHAIRHAFATAAHMCLRG